MHPHAPAPQTVDLDRDDQSYLPAADSVAKFSLPSSSSPFPDAPVLSQKRVSGRAQHPPPPSNLNPNPITAPSFSLDEPDSSSAPLAPYSYSRGANPHASNRRDPDLAADSAYKGLRPKASYHQSLLNLRDELHRPSDSGACHSCGAVGVRMLIIVALPPVTIVSQSPSCT